MDPLAREGGGNHSTKYLILCGIKIDFVIDFVFVLVAILGLFLAHFSIYCAFYLGRITRGRWMGGWATDDQAFQNSWSSIATC